jgi:hypothetical protein
MIPHGVLKPDHPFLSCLICGRLSHTEVCGRCREQLELVQAWIFEACRSHQGGQSYAELLRSFKSIGVNETMVRVALLTLLIDGTLEEADHEAGRGS